MNTIRTNSTAHDMKLAVMRYNSQQAERVQDEMAQHFWVMIGTANQTAFMAIEDAVDMMQEAGMYKHQAKQKGQAAVEAFHRYERAAYNHYKMMDDDRYPLWQDLVGRAALKLQPDVQKLFFAIKNVIDRSRVSNAAVLAQIQTGVALITLSTLMYDTMASQYQRQTLLDIHRMFDGGRLTAVESNRKQVGEFTGRQVMQDVNLRDDPQCQLGIEVLLRRYQDAEFLNEAAGEALRLNPQSWHHATPEDIALMEKLNK